MSDPRPLAELPEGLSDATLGVRGGIQRTEFREMAEPLFLTQGYVYDEAADAEAAFKGQLDRFIYSRYGNPTVSAFEERLRLLEGAEACFATATGMSAVFTSIAALVRTGSRIVSGRALFGSTVVLLNDIFSKWGVTTEYVDAHDLSQWEAALATPADVVLFETPSNPMQDIVDIAKVTELAHRAGAVVILDNVFATPILQKPLEFGVDVVVYSATKHIDGQGRVLGGAILGSREYVEGPVKQLIRNTGPSLSPFNAWVLLKGLETLALRVRAQTAAALDLAHWLEDNPLISRVRYPFLDSHPQVALAKEQMSGGGTVVTFDLALDGEPDEDKARAFAFLDSLRLVDVSNNLGDVKSIVTHPATTTHSKISREARAAVGIYESTVRLSVGLEDPADLKADLTRALGHL
ncbi:O-succinylhomoserine sulfhydrylase [Occultella glacieicola]|uniref:O-succinylhomoserine sulfhydrylase n=1 Tax=Occultella glacieicola TaxID=2518684 RepID=A0ABY2E116_9MICO|nr:O-succinylhomoserine sulfhydrylase [Occultella glacieicola]TDE91640.1 O-succinylhomoserine sulfhydrylase [Occultella glacieicola]